MTPIRTGVALAVTVWLFYVLCALIWVLAPGQFLSFMNNHVPWHGLHPYGEARCVRVVRFLGGDARAQPLRSIT
jgi:hypothetical protein